MKPLDLITGTILLFITAMAQLIVSRWGLAPALMSAFGAGVIVEATRRLSGFSLQSPFAAPAISAAGSMVGLAMYLVGSDDHLNPALWTAPVVAAFPSACLAAVNALRSPRCQLCRQSTRRLLSFMCPRCQLLTCENCWIFETCRCRLCEENQIALFPQDAEWWGAQLGPQLHVGKCNLCLRSAKDVSVLRSCPNCHHGQCQMCWDHNNGCCGRCNWTMSGLPQQVMEHVALATGSREPK
jgi:hypothetical protein